MTATQPVYIVRLRPEPHVADGPREVEGRAMNTLDPRLAFLARASARLMLIEAGEISPDDALPGMACPTCGASPCVNPSFCAACKKADARRRERSNVVPAIRPTPRPTIEAVMHAVRERGVAALREPATAERLERCDAAAQAEIEQRIANLRKD